ncbi:hypothetical protein [Gillisia sp. Hel_I_29]|uniref:hypothetical protein n=1 Tax=Gillisia sp. Hel_I_29 TaxID=1249975 RepID=UPI000A62AC52|nr:hypothetical protein [Gillisia sp. Hel_I_29]
MDEKPSQNKGEEKEGKDQDRNPKNSGRNKISKESQESERTDLNTSPQDDQIG